MTWEPLYYKIVTNSILDSSTIVMSRTRAGALLALWSFLEIEFPYGFDLEDFDIHLLCCTWCELGRDAFGGWSAGG